MNNPHVSVPVLPSSDDPAVVFDVRFLPGREKHARIFQRWLELPVDGFFVLLNDHDPVPLYYQFDAQFKGAFSWEYLEEGPEEFRVKITKLVTVSAPMARPVGARPVTAGPVSVGELDVRGLEPPEPLMRILAELGTLPAGQQLRARTDREPCHLFGEAAQRGFRHDCHAQPDGSWLTTLERI